MAHFLPYFRKFLLFFYSILLLGFFNIAVKAQTTKLVGTGTLNGGSIFAINLNGSDPEKWVDFSTPYNSVSNLIESNSLLWGTINGGESGQGILFTLNLDGTGFNIVYVFEGTAGSGLFASLLESNGKIWGTTSSGGANGLGTIFSINKDGTGFSKVHDFESTTGGNPNCGLIESNGKLWGTTSSYGSNGFGVIYSLNLDGTGYIVVHNFEYDKGSQPLSELVESGGQLWGTTSQGGLYNNGVIFSINTDGTLFTVHEDFFSSKGKYPKGKLLVYNDELWGTASGTIGVVFSIKNDGSSYTEKIEMKDYNLENPEGDLILSDGKFWGTTTRGGTNGYGAIFNMNPDGTGFTVVHEFNKENNNGAYPKNSLFESNGKLWGTTLNGGVANLGTIFSIEKDGSNFKLVYDCNNPKGYKPIGTFTEKNRKLWGVTKEGGNYGKGTVFSVGTDGANHNVLHHFDGDMGRDPDGSLLSIGAAFYGVTTYGGSNDEGTLYRMDDDGSNFEILHHFELSTGQRPKGQLIKLNDKLWGTTISGAANGYGGIFSIKTDGTEYEINYDFTHLIAQAALIVNEGIIWGTTAIGGENNLGTVFSFDPSSDNFSQKHDFNTAVGSYPYGSLLTVGGKFLGLAAQGGSNGLGSLYSMNLDGSSFVENFPFESENGKYPYGSLIESNGFLWGLTFSGGTNDLGVVFRLNLDGSNYTVILNLDSSVTGGRPQFSSLTGVTIKENQVIDFTLNDKTYGDDSYTFFATSNTTNDILFSSSDSDVVLINGTKGTILSAGEVTISASQAETDSYYAGSMDQSVNVSKASLTATADDQSKTYGEANPKFAISYEGFKNGDDESDLDNAPIASTAADATSDVGAYAIGLGEGTDKNYDIVVSAGNLTVTKASLKVSAIDETITKGDEIPDFKLSYVGFVNDDNESEITSPSISTAATQTSETGTYDITLSGGEATNYVLTLVNGTLTIEELVNILSVKNKGVEIATYPNPTSNSFQLSEGTDIKRLLIYTQNGNLVKEFENPQSSYDIQSLKPGLYTILIESTDQMTSRKLIKQ